jgi:hypothetical protein
MNNMDDKYIAENDVIKRYLKDKLTAQETTEFEEYILDKPELLEQIELDAILVENYSTALEEVNKEDAENVDENFISTIKRLLDRPLVQNVASIVNRPLVNSIASFAFGVVVILFINTSNVDKTPYSGTIDLVEVSPLRSSSSEDVPDATYSLSNNADHIMLLLQPGFIESESVMVTITRRSDGGVVFSEKVSVNSSGDLVVVLRRISIIPELYNVSIHNNQGSESEIKLALLVKN